MLITDKDHTAEIVTLNQKGEPVSRKKLKVSLYKLSWKWWWDQSANQVVRYSSSTLTTPVVSRTIETNEKGEGSWKFRVIYPKWGRYLVRVCDEGGHCSGKIVYIDWPGWAGRGRGEQAGGGASMLTFSSDKGSYIVGEDIILSIPTGEKGRALISIESGSSVLRTTWINAVKGFTHFTFKAEPGMVPNVYAHVTLLQPHAMSANDLPIRMYGVIPIKVEDPNTRLKPVLKMPDILQPEEEVEIVITERQMRPMT